jgi:hypothetical protein
MQSPELAHALISEITDTSGALLMLSTRLGRDYSRDTLHYHVRQGNLPAYIFEDGDLVRWRIDTTRVGASYIFLKRDIENLPLESKVGRKPRRLDTV